MSKVSMIIPALVILGILFIASIVSSVFMGMSSKGDSTLIVMAGMFMFTAPYALLGIISLIVYHNKQSQIIAYTVNLFALVMLTHWIFINLVGMAPDMPIGDHFNVTIWDTLIHAIILDVVFVIVLVVEAQLIWVPTQKK